MCGPGAHAGGVGLSRPSDSGDCDARETAGAGRSAPGPARSFVQPLVVLAALSARRKLLLLVPLEGGRIVTACVRGDELLVRVALLGARAWGGPGLESVAATIRRLELGLGDWAPPTREWERGGPHA